MKRIDERKMGVIVTLDVDSVEEAFSLFGKLRPHVAGFKIGMELMTAMLWSIFSSASTSRDALSDSMDMISQLFSSLGAGIIEVSAMVRNLKGSGCEGIIFTMLPVSNLILVGKNGKKMAIRDGTARKSTHNYYVLVGQEVTKAVDPVEAVKKVAAKTEITTKDRFLWE